MPKLSQMKRKLCLGGLLHVHWVDWWSQH